MKKYIFLISLIGLLLAGNIHCAEDDNHGVDRIDHKELLNIGIYTGVMSLLACKSIKVALPVVAVLKAASLSKTMTSSVSYAIILTLISYGAGENTCQISSLFDLKDNFKNRVIATGQAVAGVVSTAIVFCSAKEMAQILFMRTNNKVGLISAGICLSMAALPVLCSRFKSKSSDTATDEVEINDDQASQASTVTNEHAEMVNFD